MNGSLLPLLEQRRLLVLAGPGGVGKTSVAAALALAAAENGRHVTVLTVDPAPRLGQALGIAAIDDQAHAVDLGAAASGSLAAMRLDTKTTFDRMVRRFAPSAEAADRLLENPIYHAVAGSLGGSEHYMAFQRLYELAVAGNADLLVVDTPPAANAAELLSAPLRLDDLIDTGAASILAEPARLLARAGSGLARASLALVLAVLERLVGSETQRQVSEFITLFEELLGGLAARAREVDALLKSASTAFIVVTRPEEGAIEAAASFCEALAGGGVHTEALVVNRLCPAPAEDRNAPGAERFAGAPPGTAEAVALMEEELDRRRRRERAALARLRGSAPAAGATLVRVESLDSDIGSPAELRSLAAQLTRAQAARPS